MSDAAIRPTTFTSGAPLRLLQFAALLRRALSRAFVAQETRPALDELPDNVLKDLGLARGDIFFVAGTLASVDQGPARGARDRLNACVAQRDTATRLSHVALRIT